MPARIGRAASGLAALLLALAGCVAQPQPEGGTHTAAYAPVSFDRLPGWPADRPAEALPAFLAGCAAMSGNLGGSGEAARSGGTAAQWRAACDAARAVPGGDDAAARAFFTSWMQPYAVTDNGSATGLFTGYWEPEVAGARSPGGQYRTALLGRPTDLVQVDLGDFSTDLRGKRVSGRLQQGRLVPYYDRAEIEAGALARQRLGILWLADPVDAFFLQIQGSGRVRLPDGRVVRVTYDGANGRPYVPIGRVLADRGEIPLNQVSMQSIRAWLEAHPAQAAEVMNTNPSFVFFRELLRVRPDEGPPGALGAPLTPGRSIAVDRSFIPLGAPVWIDTTDPVDGSRLQRMAVAQDVGGAIRGPVRVDVFWGWGPQAEQRAGQARQQGSVYVLLPRAAGG